MQNTVFVKILKENLQEMAHNGNLFLDILEVHYVSFGRRMTVICKNHLTLISTGFIPSILNCGGGRSN